ncbi:MAG TPA: trehalose-phosphatase [Gemmata sp.]|nr:trehalose-phosphatase [Gemmata sp.]
MPTEVMWNDCIRAAFGEGRSIALLFDYDGTLTPIVAHPSLALLSEPMRHTLRLLASIERVHVGVISGRALRDLQRMVRLDGLYYAGSSGAELDLRGLRIDAPVNEEVRTQLATALDRLQAVLADFPGIWVEPKPAAFAVHHRGAQHATVTSFQNSFSKLMTGFPDLAYLHVCEAYEVTPREGWDKATAVTQILGHIPPDVLPAYFGDSENDTPAMLATREAGGLAIAVGAFEADFAPQRIPSPEHLHPALASLVRTLR